MRKGQSSLTALAVASARALASSTQAAVLNPHDQVAERLLPRPWSLAVRALGSKLGGPWLARAATHASFGLVDHVALRTAVIDRWLASAIERGARQVVILGAGFDTRAYRLESLRDATVYEIDHPDSQREKRTRSERAEQVAARLEYVALDFAAGGLGEALRRAGHRPTEPSCWLAEGLVPYLAQTTIEATLHEVGVASAQGSELAITYVTPNLVWLQHAKPLFLGSMRLIGEPLQSPIAREQLASLLEANGFGVEHDSDTHDWAHELCANGTREPLISYERLALATKR